MGRKRDRQTFPPFLFVKFRCKQLHTTVQNHKKAKLKPSMNDSKGQPYRKEKVWEGSCKA